ncbi:MAG: DUF106 domain-containing protein [Nanoarchaeota archaeon]|nr:DUF106 domain-containing protein [Nanoarchaeota archaeon]
MVIEIIQTHPRWSIIVIAGMVSFFISLINYFVLDKDKVKEMKQKQKKLNAEMKAARGDSVKTMELQKELMSHMGENFKHSMKPMIITIIPVLVVFWWIKGIFEETTIAGNWLWYYIGSAIAFSLVFRKVFKLP